MYRLLIVDDEPKIVKGVELMLDWESYGVSMIGTATSYGESVQKLVEVRPHIAILDVCLDGMRGYNIIEAVKPFALPTKYIMISGYDEFEYARQAMHAGAKDYLMKPVSREELGCTVDRIIREDFGGRGHGNGVETENLDPVLGVPYTSLSNLTEKVILMVKEGYGRSIHLNVIAQKFKMNSNYLGQIFLNETHLKFSEYLMAYRMILAKERIENTGDKIYAIARDAGYTNLNYFYIHFKMYFGYSPSELRGKDESEGV